jgi:hypothetical protein
MHATLGAKVKKHVEHVRKQILGSNPVPRLILEHILADKFSKSINEQIRESARTLTTPTVNHLVSHLVQEKYEQRVTSGNIFDDYVSFLSGELLDGGVRCINMEVSYTKEQQKQR